MKRNWSFNHLSKNYKYMVDLKEEVSHLTQAHSQLLMLENVFWFRPVGSLRTLLLKFNIKMIDGCTNVFCQAGFYYVIPLMKFSGIFYYIIQSTWNDQRLDYTLSSYMIQRYCLSDIQFKHTQDWLNRKNFFFKFWSL